jgi:small ligand-binding sensory domain FIST
MTSRNDTDASGRAAVTAAGGADGVAAIEGGATWDIAVDAVLTALAGAEDADLAIVFVDSRFSDHYVDILARLDETLRPAQLIGCSGQVVVGPGREAEDTPAISVMALRLPGAVLTPIALPEDGARAARALAALADAEVSAIVLFADPYSVNADHLIAGLEERYPEVTLIGGLASSHNGGRGTALFQGAHVRPSGTVILALGGAVEVRTVVAQGAQPIGHPWTITAAERNFVQTIGNRPAIDVLRETIAELDEATRERASRNLLVGLAINEYRHEFGRGDYLIRNLLGYDQESGAVAVSANVRVGQTLQFQFRDAAAADEDLRVQLADVPAAFGHGQELLGVLLCTCNGRGRDLFGVPDHDAGAIRDALGAPPIAGLFCNGEIGPISGRTFMHGFTASLGLFLTTGRQAADAGDRIDPAVGRSGGR